MKNLYKITDGKSICLYYAKSIADAIRRHRVHHDPNAIVKCETVLTDQGYPLVKLRDVPKGSYFHRVSQRDGEFHEFSAVWCKDEYDPSTKKWTCYKYEDFCDSRELPGGTYVTIDFTF